MNADQSKTIYYPRESVEAKYKAGELDLTIRHLYEFLERNVDAVIHLAIEHKHKGVPQCFLDAAKELIQHKGGLNLPFEMAQVIKEMHKEIWYRGEEGIYDTRTIEEDWQLHYGPKWRQARIIEAHFLVEELQKEVLTILGQENLG
jgi:hypothetical protein